jgi:hypothetical protein
MKGESNRFTQLQNVITMMTATFVADVLVRSRLLYWRKKEVSAAL